MNVTSLPVRGVVVVASSHTIGANSRSSTPIDAVAVGDCWPPAVARYVNVAVPSKPGAGVNVTVPVDWSIVPSVPAAAGGPPAIWYAS